MADRQVSSHRPTSALINHWKAADASLKMGWYGRDTEPENCRFGVVSTESDYLARCFEMSL